MDYESAVQIWNNSVDAYAETVVIDGVELPLATMVGALAQADILEINYQTHAIRIKCCSQERANQHCKKLVKLLESYTIRKRLTDHQSFVRNLVLMMPLTKQRVEEFKFLQSTLDYLKIKGLIKLDGDRWVATSQEGVL